MAKKLPSIEIPLPRYHHSRKSPYAWRRTLLKHLNEHKPASGWGAWRNVPVEVIALVSLKDSEKSKNRDADNILKHILDALQGRAGGGKSQRMKHRLLDNDSQVQRAVIQKRLDPKKFKNRDRAAAPGQWAGQASRHGRLGSKAGFLA